MDKILITQFKNEIATAILNLQEKLNPNGDAYIDKNELNSVLDFFGVKDVSTLLKPSDSDSIFQSKETKPNTGEDSVELSTTPKDSTDETLQSKETKPGAGEDTVELSTIPEDKTDAFDTQGSAAHELSCRTDADLALSTVGTPYSAQLDALMKARSAAEKAGKNTNDIDNKIEALRTLVEDFLRNNPSTNNYNNSNSIVKQITYGKNNDKKAILSQSFQLDSNNAKKINTGDTEPAEEDAEGETTAPANSTNTDAEVNYNVEFKTLNDQNKGNWHGFINFSSNLRQTIENNNNVGSYGASLDYTNKKLSTGVFGMYNSTELDGTKTSTLSTQVYGKYKKSMRLALGAEKDDEQSYYYVRGAAHGKRDFPNSSISINGGASVETGFLNLKEYEGKCSNTEIKLNGGIAFKAKEFGADLSTNLTYKRIHYEDDMPSTGHAYVGSVVSNIYTKNFDITATVSAMKNTYSYEFDGVKEKMSENPSVTTSIMIKIKELLGKNVTPVLKFNTGNYSGATQNLGIGVIVSP